MVHLFLFDLESSNADQVQSQSKSDREFKKSQNTANPKKFSRIFEKHRLDSSNTVLGSQTFAKE